MTPERTLIPEKMLMVDDEVDLLDGLSRMLAPELPGLEVIKSAEERHALRLLDRSSMDLVLLDIRLPEIDGLDLLEMMLKKDPLLTVVMMTGHGTIELAVEAMKRGAYDFLTKPFDKPALIRAIQKGLERNRLLRENRYLRRQVGGNSGFEGLVGQSQPMRRLYDIIQVTAGTDYSVLIQGESGTGKELTARAIHNQGHRRASSMVAVNCPAIPGHLLESELFGHKKGAFTSADRDRKGLFEIAHKSTIFLDEIGDLPLNVQTKLLRVLQEKEFRPLGAVRDVKTDVRIIAATNKNLEEAVRESQFREDLYYRLNVVPVRTPPLREIREDIPLLVAHFNRLACAELDIPAKRFSAEALEALMKRPWPGNIRELQNVVRRAIIFSPEPTIRSRDLPVTENSAFHHFPGSDREFDPAGDLEPYMTAKDRVVNQFTMTYVTALLEKTGGNVTRAAEMSGLGRASLQKIMRRLGIRSELYKNEI